MGHRFKATRGLIWYPLAKPWWVAVIPNRNSAEKCLLLGPDEAALLNKIDEPLGVPVEDLTPAEIDRLEAWVAPEFGIVERVEEDRPSDPYADLACRFSGISVRQRA